MFVKSVVSTVLKQCWRNIQRSLADQGTERESYHKTKAWVMDRLYTHSRWLTAEHSNFSNSQMRPSQGEHKYMMKLEVI